MAALSISLTKKFSGKWKDPGYCQSGHSSILGVYLPHRKNQSALILSHTLPYFNPTVDTKVIIDASPVGYGIVLLQFKAVVISL